MPTHEIIVGALAVIGGIGCLVNGLVSMSMVDALNAQRPMGDSIPNPGVTWDEWKCFWKHPGFDYWGILRRYREQFPGSRLLFWHTASLVWAFSFFAAALIITWR